MSLPTFPFPPEQLTRDDAINLILSSIAMEEVGLSHIINAEGEKLQYMLGTLSGMTAPAGTVDQVLQANESVQKMLQTASYNQMFLSAKMENALAASDANQTNQPPASIPFKDNAVNFDSGSLSHAIVSEYQGTGLNINIIIGGSSMNLETQWIGEPIIPEFGSARLFPASIAGDATVTAWIAELSSGTTVVTGTDAPPLVAQLWYAPPMATSPFNYSSLTWTLVDTIDFGAISLAANGEGYRRSHVLDTPFDIAAGGYLVVRFGINTQVIQARLSVEHLTARAYLS